MLDRLAKLAGKRPRWIALLAAVYFVAAGAIGSAAFDVLQPFGFEDPDSESTVVEERFEELAGASPGPRVVLLFEPVAEARSEAGVSEIKQIRSLLDEVEGIARTTSYAGLRDESFVSSDGTQTLILGFLDPALEDTPEEDTLSERLQETFEKDSRVTVGGPTVAFSQIGETVESDLQRAELYALPIILLLSFLVFRSLVAALLPPLVGILAIVGTLAGLRLLGEVTDVSVFAVNLATGLGLGLAIDYSLFMISRYREEIAKRGAGQEALLATMRTAGRTVLFSSLTVAAALAALTVFPQRFLFSMGIGGAMVALLAALISLTLLPAILAMLGERINSLAPRRLRRSAEADARGEHGRWYRFSKLVMRRPGIIALVTTAALIAVGLPFLDSRFTFADAGILPERLSGKQVDQAIDENFDQGALAPVTVQFEGGAEALDAAERLASEVREVPDVRAVNEPAEVAPGLIRLQAVQEVPVQSERGEEIVREIRRITVGEPFRVGGDSAALVDQKQSLGDHLILAIAIIVAATLILLFLMTGSVILPIKALLMNLLTVSATFGLLVLIFQDGRLEGLLDFTSTGALDSSQPILLFALVFGLSTDYGVFLLTRIKEARDEGHPNEVAVALGLERTGRIVTFAALLFAIAIGSFVTSDIVFIKQAGVGTALGVLIDAAIIRALLVPALMAMLGEWNWWAPGPLRRLHDRIGISESGPGPEVATATGPGGAKLPGGAEADGDRRSGGWSPPERFLR